MSNHRYAELAGQRFGHLIVERRALPAEIPTDRYRSDNSRWWACRCDCGNFRSVNTKRLRAKGSRVTGCGCMGKKKPLGQAAKWQVFKLVEVRARKRRKEFSLSFEQFIDITSSACYYCGIAWSSMGPKHPRFHGGFKHNGIDRLDSAKGYVQGNCVASCTTCNYAKNTMTVEQFKAWIIRVHDRFARQIQ